MQEEAEMAKAADERGARRQLGLGHDRGRTRGPVTGALAKDWLRASRALMARSSPLPPTDGSRTWPGVR